MRVRGVSIYGKNNIYTLTNKSYTLTAFGFFSPENELFLLL